MRTPFIISSSAHAAILFAAIVGIRADSFEVEEPPPIPVDILTVDEFTQLTSKAPAPEREVEEPAPEPEPKPVVEEEPEPEPEPEEVAALEPELLPPEPEPEPAPEPEPVSEAEPLPLPEPEPLPPEPVAEPVPEPVAAPEREVEEVAEPEPEPEPELVEVVAPPRKKPTPPPSVRTALAQPKPEEPKKEEKKFDVDRISALLNKLPDEAKPRPAPPVQGEGSPNQERNLGGVDQTLTLSEVAFLRRQVERCWRLPAGIANAADMVVKVQLNLNPDGSLAGTPVVLNTGGPGFDVAASGAIRAVIQCQPYTLPADKYDAWRDLTFNFDPSQMLGG